jgi:hypothetical protein
MRASCPNPQTTAKTLNIGRGAANFTTLSVVKRNLSKRHALVQRRATAFWGGTMQSQILGPVIALVGWSLVMWVWLYARRIPAMKAAKIDIGKLTGGTGSDLKQVIPAKSQWPADNYNHLMEQPTLFYAICLTLAVMGQGDNLNATIAWAYVALRVAHSVVQATVNRIVVRFTLFALATIPLIMLTVHAAMAFWGLSFH